MKDTPMMKGTQMERADLAKGGAVNPPKAHGGVMRRRPGGEKREGMPRLKKPPALARRWVSTNSRQG